MHEVLDVDLLLVHGESLLTPEALVFGAVPGLLAREVSLHHVEVQVLLSLVRRQRVISAKFAHGRRYRRRHPPPIGWNWKRNTFINYLMSWFSSFKVIMYEGY